MPPTNSGPGRPLTPQEQRVPGRTVLITGASSGIGAAAARRLHHLGATVVPIGRDPHRTAAIAAEIGTRHHLVDFAALRTVRTLADDILDAHPVIDVLALNAGATIPHRTTTEDGHELTFQLNHLGPFLLLQLLADRLIQSRARVVLTSSVGHRIGALDLDDLDFTHRRYWAPRVYGTAKQANIVTAREISRRLPGVQAAAFHPGVVGSAFGADAHGTVGWLYRSPLGRRLTITPDEGAAPLVALASLPAHRFPNRTYLNRFRTSHPSRRAHDDDLAAALWTRSRTLLTGV